jgi:molybdate transport system ATP-binding protein
MEDPIILDFEKKLISSEGPVNLEIKARVPPGGLTVLFGESGAGKTSFLRIIAGLTQPDKGYICVGNDVWFDSKRGINLSPQKRNIGFMFQDYALFPNMTVKQNIAYAQLAKNDKALTQLINDFGLVEFADRRPVNLSGGQKQRVALARALAREPKVLLLDEPLSALDASMRNTLQDEIIRVHQISNATTFVVSHDLSEVFRLAQKVICIKNGKISASGKPADVFLNTSISGKVQITGCIVDIEPVDTFYLITVVTGFNQLIKVTAFCNDVEKLCKGDQIMVYSKAFNPLITKI